MNADQKASLLRGGLKVFGAALVTFGVINTDDANILVPIVADLVGSALAIWGFVSSHLNHKE